MSCPSTQVYHSRGFVEEVFAWTGLGLLVFAARFTVRLRILPWRKLQGDDHMATVTLLAFIMCIVGKMYLYYRAPISDYSEDEIAGLLDCQIARLVLSSKIQIFLWYAYATFLWGLKAMVLFFFNRLPLRPYQRRLHKLFAVLSGLAYVAVMLTITLSCLPLDLAWTAIPYPPSKCRGRDQLFFTISISNAATDIAILTVALPLLWHLRTTLQRRLELTLLLCSGIFVTTACLTAFFMAMTDPDSSLNVNLWGTREEIAGIVAVNAPIIRPMFRKSFWKRDFDPSKRPRLPRARPRMIIPRREGYMGRTASERDWKSTVIAMLSRRLGVLTSAQSLSSGSPTRSEAPMSGPILHELSSGPPTKPGTPLNGPISHAQSTIDLQRINEGEFKELEWAWAVPGAIVEQSLFAPRGPRPLLPDPGGNFSSQDTLYHANALQSISEEEESIGAHGYNMDPPRDCIVDLDEIAGERSATMHDTT